MHGISNSYFGIALNSAEMRDVGAVNLLIGLMKSTDAVLQEAAAGAIAHIRKYVCIVNTDHAPRSNSIATPSRFHIRAMEALESARVAATPRPSTRASYTPRHTARTPRLSAR